MKFEFFISLRYLKSKKENKFISRISMIAILVVVLSVMVPLVVMNVLNGFHETIKDKLLDKDFHIQIMKTTEFSDYDNLIEQIKSLNCKEIQLISPFFQSQALLKSRDNYNAVLIRAFPPDFYDKDKSFKKNFPVKYGKFELNKNYHITIGEALAKKLGIDFSSVQKGEGPLIDILVAKKKDYDNNNVVDKNSDNNSIFYDSNSSNVDSKILSKTFKVGGIYFSGYAEYDNNLVFTSLKSAQSLCGEKDNISGIGLKLNNRNNIYKVQNIFNSFSKFDFNNYQDYDKRSIKRIKSKTYKFSYRNSRANKVYITGSFNNWNPNEYELKKYKNNVWEIVIENLPDIFYYSYIIDDGNISYENDPYNTDNFLLSYIKKDWSYIHSNLFKAFDWEKNLMTFVLGIMVIASLLTIYLTLNVVVMDKKTEIGILKSYGTKTKSIKIIFIMEGFLIGFIGTVIGGILGILITISLSDMARAIETVVNTFLQIIYNSIFREVFGLLQKPAPFELISGSVFYAKNFPYEIRISDILLLCSLSILVSLIAAYFPSNRAAKSKIIDVIRYE